ncbi:hypothetical protein SAMN05192539_103833 [Paraburkholderia diazotrophica]|uniref:Uncharacterized protein n=1 Tax=Paraburkholderia diazotrophica TaxID=667676 RepID=A0A1H7DZV4_9BURK|nr:hypothetical protein SAMN05192539_103833 [Paraburkholderia diazotrophica]
MLNQVFSRGFGVSHTEFRSKRLVAIRYRFCDCCVLVPDGLALANDLMHGPHNTPQMNPMETRILNYQWIPGRRIDSRVECHVSLNHRFDVATFRRLAAVSNQRLV